MRKGLIVLSILIAGMFVYGDSKDLGTIVVTPTRSIAAEKDSPANVTVITQDEIQESNARDVGELLESFSFIKIGRNGSLGSVSSISMRGSTAEQVLVMIDGRPALDTAFGTPQPHQLLLPHIERIEIVRGGASSLYGANAVGGVINIITKQPESEQPVTDIGITYGSFNQKLYNLGFSLKKNIYSLYMSGDRHLSDGYRHNEDFKANHVFTRASIAMEHLGTVTLQGDLYQSKAGVPGINLTPVNAWDNTRERSADTPHDRMESDNRYGLLEHSLLIGETARIRTRLYGNMDERKLYYGDSILFGPPFYPDSLWENKSVGMEIQADLPLQVTVGGDYRRDSLFQEAMDTNTQLSDTKFINRALYVQQQLVFDAMTVIPGIRIDNHSTYDPQTNPKITLLYVISPAWLLSLNAGRSFRSPTFNEVLNNADIQPEIGKSYDLGIRHTGNKVSAQSVLFLTDTKDLVVWQPPLWLPVNVSGTTRSQGIEFDCSRTFLSFMRHEISYTYNVVKNRETHKTIFYKPFHKINYRLAFFNQKGLTCLLDAEGVGRQFINQDETASIPGYGLMHLRLSQKIHSAVISVGIDNLFDKRYVTRNTYPLAGRTLYGTLTIQFID